jgi:D-sedoheptulose 7-phosphate isomerase
MEKWDDYLKSLFAGFQGLVVTGTAGAPLAVEQAFRQWIALAREVKEQDRAVYIIGNGASASIASHIAADALKKARLRAFVFNDQSLLTAISNDNSFEEVFALPLSHLGRPGDLVISISSSGNSPNIVRALEIARQLSMRSVTLSGMKPDNRSRALGDLNFYVPSPQYGWVECAHHGIMHYWLDQYLNRYCGGAT